ncbi:MAG: type III pantothenate kinase [Flavobacteriaceae bacterium]|jgi:type III pantothenate kinase|nr:type III pantothenate kinase [Flavobacteriaceae bacterium]
MLLVVNIGNSNIRFGIFKGEDCVHSWVMNTKPYKTEDELFSQFNMTYQNYGISTDDITEIAVGSVVPHLTYPVRKSLSRLHNVRTVLVNRNTPTELLSASPQMGTDLYANVYYAHKKYKGTKIIVDFGTALTLICVDKNGEVRGAIIAAGVVTSLNSLISATAQLSDVEMRIPKKVLGKTTDESMQSGIVFGFVSMVEGLIDRINTELGEETYVIATGGTGHIFAPLTNRINIYDRFHTIKGLRELYLNHLAQHA